MNPTAFDDLARAFSAAGSRRRLLARLAALPLVGALAVVSEEAAAERPLTRLQRRTQQRNRKQRNNKDKRKDNGPGKGRPLDCADATIRCTLVDDAGFCTTTIGYLGPVGHCYVDLCCGPCGYDHDQDHWTSQCNNTFESACNGNCVAIDQGTLPCFEGCAF